MTTSHSSAPPSAPKRRKRRKSKMTAIALGLVGAVGVAAFIVLSQRSDDDNMTAEAVEQERKKIALLPAVERLAKWREWATHSNAPALQQDAFAELAWAKDPQGLGSVVLGLSSSDHRVRGRAATALAEYGSPMADRSKSSLLKAFNEAESGDRPQIAWALAALKEPTSTESVLKEFRDGHFAQLQRLDDSPAFDPEVLVTLAPAERFAPLANDENANVRQLAAIALSRDGRPIWASALIKLVSDPNVEVAREAAVGLGKIRTPDSLGPLLGALRNADKASRPRFLDALRDGLGGQGLLVALQSLPKDVGEHERFQTQQIFDSMRELQDPSAASGLVNYIDVKPAPHFRTEAAFRLAEVGDLRAVPTLAWRLEQDPMTLYSAANEAELRRDDKERVVCARLLADLALLYPEKRDQIRSQAEKSMMTWLAATRYPNANGLRFLAAVQSPEAIAKLRSWSDPPDPLPKASQAEISDGWTIAQGALRYLGWTRDPKSWDLLLKQLNRRPPDVDTSEEGLTSGTGAALGMVLRGAAVGASQGFAQWGDPKAFPHLTKFIEDPHNNEQARLEACASLAWVTTEETVRQVVQKIHDGLGAQDKAAWVRQCYLVTLRRRPDAAAVLGLVDLLKPEVDIEVRHQAALVLATGGLTRDARAPLMARLMDPSLHADAALALMLGSNADTATQALASYEDSKPEELEELKGVYRKTFDNLVDQDYDNGTLARWVDAADALARTRIRGVLQDWPRAILAHALRGVEFDQGPHSLTRVQLRVRLLRDADGPDDAKGDAAIAILKLMNEKGALLALREKPGARGMKARQALFDVMNPKPEMAPP